MLNVYACAYNTRIAIFSGLEGLIRTQLQKSATAVAVGLVVPVLLSCTNRIIDGY